MNAEPITAPTAEERAIWEKDFSPEEQEMHGMRPVTDGGLLYCGVVLEEYAINGVTYAWPVAIKKLRWSLNFSRLGQLSDMDFKDAATAWFKEISDCCDRLFEYTSNPRMANILYTVQRLDGRNSVLADMQIPVGNVTPDTQLTGRFDDSEAWTLATTPGQGEIGAYPVGLHETEHAMGLGHKPTSVTAPALIAPIYNPLIRNLQAADIAEFQRRYGKSATAQPPPATPPIKGYSFSVGRGDERVSGTVEYPSDTSVSVKLDVAKGERKQTFSGTKPI